MKLKTRRIVSDPGICSGKPYIKGTRIPVHIILGLLAAGETRDNIQRAYPHITEEDISACLEYAAFLADEIEKNLVIITRKKVRIRRSD